MLFKRHQPANRKKESLYSDLFAIIKQARADMSTTVSLEKVGEQRVSFEAHLLERLVIYIIERDYRVAQEYFKRGQEEAKHARI